jgi:hypothetical protein
MGGTGGVAGAPVVETGDPQTLQKETPSDTADPHFEQNAIIPPVGLACLRMINRYHKSPFQNNN